MTGIILENSDSEEQSQCSPGFRFCVREIVMLFGRKSPPRFWDAAEYLCLNATDLRKVIGADRWDGMVTALLAAKPDSQQWRDAITAVHQAAITAGLPRGLGLGATMGGGFPPPWHRGRPAGPARPTAAAVS